MEDKCSANLIFIICLPVCTGTTRPSLEEHRIKKQETTLQNLLLLALELARFRGAVPGGPSRSTCGCGPEKLRWPEELRGAGTQILWWRRRRGRRQSGGAGGRKILYDLGRTHPMPGPTPSPDTCKNRISKQIEAYLLIPNSNNSRHLRPPAMMASLRLHNSRCHSSRSDDGRQELLSQQTSSLFAIL